MFYQAVVAAVLLYGSNTWCLTETALRPLNGFHVEAARRISGKRPRKVKRRDCDDVWVYPHSADVLAAAGLHPLRHYIDKRRATTAKSIQDRPVLVECMGAERREGTPRRLCWWQQVLDYAGEEEGEEAGPTEGLESLAPPARRPPTPPPPPARRARVSPVRQMTTAEEEAFDALMAAAHFHD